MAGANSSLSPSRLAANRISERIKDGFRNYLDHWQEWIVPMLWAAAITVLSLTCCVAPYFLLLGPVTVGLYACAMTATRGKPVEAIAMRRGWERALPSMVVSIVSMVVLLLPILMMYGGFFACFLLMAAALPREQHTAHSPRTSMAREESNSVDGQQLDPPTVSGGNSSSDALRTRNNERSRERPEEPPPLVVMAMVVGMLVFYLLSFLFLIGSFAFQLWLSTRLMFAFPLIADRDLGGFEAIGASWRATRTGFWELFAINLIASMIGGLGLYAMYLGMLFTMPICFTIIASLYQERMGAATGDVKEPLHETRMATDHRS